LSKFVDLHNHILPGIDDGPATMKEALQLARALVRAGFDTVVATPHTFEGNPSPALIIERLSDLQNELNRLKIPLKLLPGAEQHIEPTTLERLEKDEIMTLNKTSYLLLELPMLQPLPVYTDELLFNLVSHGYRPVIPHPERTRELQRNTELLLRLHKAGAIFQLTWGALVGSLGKVAQKTAHAMLSLNLAHLFSTDAHSVSANISAAGKAAAYLENLLGTGTAEIYLSARPRRLLSNQAFDLDLPAKLTLPPGKLFSFRNRFR